MSDYKRLTMEGSIFDNIINCVVCPNKTEKYNCRKDKTNCLNAVINRLAELETKIENGTLIEVDKNLIGEGVIGIHCYMDGTFGVCLDENIVIGFDTDGVVTWNNVHKYNDYFKNGCYFIDNEKGRTQLKAKLKELNGEV